MTTIAFKAGVLAADTQATSGDDKVDGWMVKIGKKGHALFGGTGSASFIRTFRAWCAAGLPGDPPRCEKDEGKSCGFLIVEGQLYEFFPCGRMTRTWIGDGPWAAGGGGDIAMGAMRAGANPRRAVKIAAEVDIYTSGEITVLTL